MQNLYADLGMFRRRFIDTAMNLDEGDQAEVLRQLEVASRRIDEHCQRHFYALTEVRVFDGNGRDCMMIPDLLSATTVKLDEDGNRAFELTLNGATDYYLKRRGAHNEDSTPKTAIELDTYNGQRSYFAEQKRLLQIDGSWGYTNAVERLTVTGTLSDAVTKTLVLSGDGQVDPGQTLLLGAEQVFVESGAGTQFVVQRGVNGTTAAAHAGVAVDRFVYVPQVRDACLILAQRVWQRGKTGFANLNVTPVGTYTATYGRIDPDVADELRPLVRWA